MHMARIVFSLSTVQQSSVFAHRRTCWALQTQLQFLKGKFHRLSGAIDFHLSMHREKVCVDIYQILADINSLSSCTSSSKFISLVLMIEIQQYSDLYFNHLYEQKYHLHNYRFICMRSHTATALPVCTV